MGGGGIVQIDERFAVNALSKDGEIFANVFRIKCAHTGKRHSDVLNVAKNFHLSLRGYGMESDDLG